ncbi:MAG: metal-dependent transcriptional regulator [Hungatella sp.]|jgi:Mn-dependent DtxR family transcriptional regulator|nr:metal-dependent transcriptional regulator [Hungatella sp.]
MAIHVKIKKYPMKEGDDTKIQESAENYLETILMLKKRNGHVRSIDIAEELDFSKPSVSVAMKNLRENGYIGIDENGHITLQEKGLEIAERIYERHTLLSEWLIDLGVTQKTALDDACRIEHVISAESFAAIKAHVNSGKET